MNNRPFTPAELALIAEALTPNSEAKFDSGVTLHCTRGQMLLWQLVFGKGRTFGENMRKLLNAECERRVNKLKGKV